MSLTVEHLIESYIKLRDTRSALKKKFNEEDGKYKAVMEQIEARVLAMANEAGTDGFTVKGLGYTYRSTSMKANCTDWNVFHAWLNETHAYDLFERRISRDVLKEYLKEHGGEAPPAVQVIYEQCMNICRAPARPNHEEK